jgi:uncharacterized protein (TIGR03083 family)
MSPAPPLELGRAYHRSRLRLAELVGSLPDAKAVAVPACPGWSAHDVVSHLAAIAQNAVAGTLKGPPSEEQAAAQVARRADQSTEEALADWAALAPGLEEMLGSVPVWPAVMDVVAHEHDVRGATGQAGFRDDPDLVAMARMLLGRMELPAPVRVVSAGEVFELGAEETGSAETIGLETDPWEVFRFRFGRRSRAQLQALKWTGDPSPVLDHLVIFGPSPLDVIE